MTHQKHHPDCTGISRHRVKIKGMFDDRGVCNFRAFCTECIWRTPFEPKSWNPIQKQVLEAVNEHQIPCTGQCWPASDVEEFIPYPDEEIPF
jgi:hypothetical protein